MTPHDPRALTEVSDLLHDARGDDGCPDYGESTWCTSTATDLLDALWNRSRDLSAPSGADEGGK